MLFVSCKMEKKTYHGSGNLEAVHLLLNGSKVDSSIYYKDNKYRDLDKIIHYLSDSSQYNVYYNDSKEISKEGATIKEGNRVGKWKFYKKDHDSIVEYKNINSSTYVNQIWTISKTKDTLPFKKSNYFSFFKGGKDTVITGSVLKINMMLVEPFYSYDTDIEVLIPFNDKELKDDFSNINEIKLDTFKSLKNDGISDIGISKDVPVNQIAEFGIKYKTSGKKRIRGVLIEYYKENATRRIERRLFFDEIIFVKPDGADISTQK